MRSTLPEAFRRQMATMLKPEELESFLESYNAPRALGLRINAAKLDTASPQFRELQEQFGLEPIPWCPTGYYYKEDTRPGKHPYHAAGFYYLQEPSAMSSAELLDPQPGETVLDLAGAPGGKSTQIAAKLGKTGLLIANEIHPSRAQILAENIERMGLSNTVVVQSTPDKLAERFPRFFDRIMLDAPCSGEGMFRKDPEAIREWSPEHVTMCAARQLDIMHSAVAMLKPGGVLGYSTCTFNLQENEELIAAVIQQYPSLRLERMERVWPHLERGEGHFVAVLRLAQIEGNEETVGAAGRAERMQGKGNPAAKRTDGTARLNKQTSEAWDLFRQFAAEALTDGLAALPDDGEPLLFGEQLYWLPHGQAHSFSSSFLEGLRTLRPGLHLATVKKNRVEPAHALALALPIQSTSTTVTFPAESAELHAYLRGEALPAPEGLSGGWIPVCTGGGQPIGWAKCSSGQLKNHYPKGLRRP